MYLATCKCINAATQQTEGIYMFITQKNSEFWSATDWLKTLKSLTFIIQHRHTISPYLMSGNSVYWSISLSYSPFQTPNDVFPLLHRQTQTPGWPSLLQEMCAIYIQVRTFIKDSVSQWPIRQIEGNEWRSQQNVIQINYKEST